MRFILSLMALTLLSTSPILAQDTKDLVGAYKDKAAIEGIIAEYLLNNPKIVVDALESYEKQREAEQAAAAKQALVDSSDQLFKNNEAPEIGNPEGDVTVVEFFDYNCGYCKRALADVVDLVEEDKNLRVVFKEVPILAESSREAARWALASKKQGKYFEYHVKLMENRGQLDAGRLESLAKSVGLDVAKLKKDKDSEAVNKVIQDNLDLMRRLGIRGTPSFVIGDELARGYVGKDQMKILIAAQREKE